MKRTLILLGVLALSGCASLPDDLSVPDSQALLPFTEAGTAQIAQQTVLWGGEIAAVSNLTAGSRVEVVQFRLDSRGRPVKSDESGGRFRIETERFVDPAIYAPGRLVTARGTFSARQSDKVGEHPYTFPVLDTDRIHLWPEIKDPPERCDCDPFLHSPFMMRPIIVVPAQKN